ncbi:NB-ARC domain-containing protein [Nocardia sp. NPDC020380]|uniref:NB-ARC domain-containing protein n=1 Tax=Nocardia sp. NPDC020380 TaxID=3364309 RepID=UPI0037A2A419
MQQFVSELSAAILRAEKQHGRVNRAQLAKRLNVATGSVYAYLNGTTLPATEVLDRLMLEVQVCREDAKRLAALRDAVQLARVREPGRRIPAGPADLPRDTPHLYGRGAELERIRTALTGERDSVTLCIVSGLGGVGKTTLAVRAARTLQAEFPDGCLFVNLLGYAAEPVMTPGEAADKLLRQLNIAAEAVPANQDRRTAMLRTELRSRSLLLVLDNAFDAAQVEPLLPAEGDCAVLITSRSNLNGLEDARHIRIAPLSARDSAELLDGLTADLDPEQMPDAAQRRLISAQCHGLPVAIRIAAAVLRSEPWPVPADIAVFHDGDRDVESLFEQSVSRLASDLAGTFTLLGVHPGPAFDLDAAAALTGTDQGQVRRQLRRLVEANLLDVPLSGRYGYHDLLRAFATRRAASTLGPDVVRQATYRIVGHYLARADAADRLLTPDRHRDGMAPAAGGNPYRYTDYHSAVQDLTANRDNLAAAAHAAFEAGLDAQCWQLAFALREFLFITNDMDLWIETHELGLAAAVRARNLYAEAITCNNLGLVLLSTGDDTAAAQLYDRARALFAANGDAQGEHTTMAHQAWIHVHRGEFEQALRLSTTALAYTTEYGNVRNTAILLRDTAHIEVSLGRCTTAVRRLLAAIELFRAIDLHVDEAMACNVLGEAYARLEMLPEASEAFERATRLGRAADSILEQARGQEGMGRIAAAQSDWPTARRHWRHALTEYLQLGDSQAVDRIKQRMTESPGGRPAQTDHEVRRTS